MRILVPVDGSPAALRAVAHVAIEAGRYAEMPEIHLINVQLPILSGNVRTFFSRERIDAYYHDEGMRVLRPARERLEASGIPCSVHIGVGNAAQTIAQYAKDRHCDMICMGRGGMGGISGMLMGSVASRLIHVSEIPILLIH